MNEPTQTRYGIRQLILINSAHYGYAQIPFDRPISISGENNHGKTTLINALQWIILGDYRDMDLDGHSLDESKQFYFPGAGSYILADLHLPSGDAVVGVVGLGGTHNHDYVHFAHAGAFDRSLYLDGTKRRPFDALQKHLAVQGIALAKLSPSEMAHALTGADLEKLRRAALSINLIPLTRQSERGVFKELYKDTLRLSSITAEKVKDYVLKVFDRDTEDSGLDFAREWRAAFSDVEIEQRRLQALIDHRDTVEALADTQQARLGLRGHFLALEPKIDTALARWDAFRDEEESRLADELQNLQAKQNDIGGESTRKANELAAHRQQVTELRRWLEQLAERQQRFALTTLDTLQQHWDAADQGYVRLHARLQDTTLPEPGAINRSLRHKQQRKRELEGRLKAIHSNLYTRLLEIVPKLDADRIARVLNPELLGAYVAEHDKKPKPGDTARIVNETDFEAAVNDLINNRVRQDVLQVGGVEINLTKLPPPEGLDKDGQGELLREIHDLDGEIAELEDKQAIAIDLATAKQQRDNYLKDRRAVEDDMRDFEAMEQDAPTAPERREALAAQERLCKQLDQDIASIAEQAATLSQTIQTCQLAQAQLQRTQAQLNDLKAQRGRRPLQVDPAAAHSPWPETITINLTDLAEYLGTFLKLSIDLGDANQRITHYLMGLESAGVNQFANKPTEDERIEAILDYWRNREQEASSIEKHARVAISRVASALQSITGDLARIHRQMTNFNRGIEQHSISNLRRFSIKVVDRERLVGALNAIVEASDAADQNDTLALFSFRDGGNPHFSDSVEQAKEYLLEHTRQGHPLNVSQLFAIHFEVIEHDGTERRFDDIEKAGSNGTRSTVKVLSSILFIRHLLNSRVRDNYQLPIFFDEGASLDEGNQQSLITTAQDNGFIPMFASVDPLTTCHYSVCVTRPPDGPTVITEDDWRIIEPLSQLLEDTSA